MPNSLGITTNKTRKPSGKSDNRTAAQKSASDASYLAEQKRRAAAARKAAIEAEQRRQRAAR